MFSRLSLPALALLALSIALPSKAERPGANAAKSATRQAPKIKQKPLEIWATVGEISKESRFDAPSSAMAQAVAQFPEMHRFRVVWSVEVGPIKTQSTAHYNRALGLFSFFSKTQVGKATTREAFRFSGVTPAMLGRLADKHEGAQSGDDSGFFGDLAKLGGKRVK